METAVKPILIKKYSNRKLYNTEKSGYVSLTELGNIVKQGMPILVIEKDSGKDVTRDTKLALLKMKVDQIVDLDAMLKQLL